MHLISAPCNPLISLDASPIHGAETRLLRTRQALVLESRANWCSLNGFASGSGATIPAPPHPATFFPHQRQPLRVVSAGW